MEGNTIEKLLSESEQRVFDYIKTQAEQNDSKVQESMKRIGEHLGVSEATVHRAIRKLKSSGIIGISASQEKAESNTIIYYGVPNAEEETDEIIGMIAKLNQRANRFKALLEQKDSEIERLTSQLKVAEERIEYLEKNGSGDQTIIQTADNKIITSKDIISVTDLGGGTIAYITRVH